MERELLNFPQDSQCHMHRGRIISSRLILKACLTWLISHYIVLGVFIIEL
jgi:hypothetical protein